METVGLQQLRQYASALVRRVEAGEEITITVAGRPRARLVPAHPRQWRSWAEVVDIFSGPTHLDWGGDRELLDDELRDP